MSELENLIQDAKEVDQESTFMKPKSVSEKKRGRGRPRKDENRNETKSAPEKDPNVPPPMPTSEIVKPIVDLYQNALVAWTGEEKVALTGAKYEALCGSVGALCDKYAPNLAGPEFVFAAIIGPQLIQCWAIVRYKKMMKLEEEKMSEKSVGASSPSGPAQPSTIRDAFAETPGPGPMSN